MRKRAPDIEERTTTDWVAVVAWGALIAGCAWWGTTLAANEPRIRVGAPPLFGRYGFHPTTKVLLPLAVLVIVAVGRDLEMPRRKLLLITSVMAIVWGVTLAVASQAGLYGALMDRHDYLAVVPRITSPLSFLKAFTDAINTYPIHVQGHPPGFALLLWLIARIGVGGLVGASALVIVATGGIAAGVVSVVWDVAGEANARRVAPFAMITPAAVWLVSSADAVFAALAVATTVVFVKASDREPSSDLLALGGGVVAGIALQMSYGLAPALLVPAVLLVHRRAVRVALLGLAGLSSVMVATAWLGFWWFDGLDATRALYGMGVSSFRPYSYFVIANVAALAVASGPAVPAGIGAVRDRRLWLIIGPVLAAVVLADLSGLSKGEVERIWLPFAVWLPVACAALGEDSRRWLVLQGSWAILLQQLVVTPW